jgi:bifunctional non-homologous end joining protein LigD
MAIEEYRRKRDFSKTPEPEPGKQDVGGNRFVVHRHEARNLHYDLRIQAGGVLSSWAVPKGFSYDPVDKRLAVRTEDHPLEYTSFEGAIPRGQYGAGTMRIWDVGEYEVRKAPDIHRAIEKGEIKLELRGRRLRGEWHMVRTKGGEGRDWLLFKARDRYAGSGSDLFGGADMSRAVQRPPLGRIARMEASPWPLPFDDPDWLFEPALAGKRVRASIDGPSVSIRAGAEDLAPELPAVVADLGKIRAERLLFDGVVVTGESAPVLYVFDVLYAEEWDLRQLALRERKAVLRSLLPDLKYVFRVDPVAERGSALAQAAAESGLPAILAKRASSRYQAGLSEDWRHIPVTAAKTRNPARKPPRPPEFAITNPRKVYWPEQGYTKGDLLAYYELTASWLLPYLKDRPLHMYRWPDGIRGKSFYQKQLPEGIPDWIETVDVARAGEEPTHYIVCNDRRTLLTLVNLGTIDIHPWLSRRGSLDSPDWAILDLDPKEAPFSNVIKVARIVGKLLRGLGLEAYLKTSGSTGLHVCIPLKPGYTYEQSRMFCEAVARLVVRDHGDIATVERVMSRRGGRVYVDFLQNRREQTVVPPYVVRPVEAASVSMPLAWDELEGELRIEDFTLATAPARIEKTGDLFRTALGQGQDLAGAIEALARSLEA